jgi:hypothetical protein
MVFAMMASFVLETVHHVGKFSSGPGRVVCENALDQADQTVIQGYIC